MNEEGWTWLMNSRKWHYFRNRMSLCGKFMLFWSKDLGQGSNDAKENCAKCRKILAQEQKAAASANGKDK